MGKQCQYTIPKDLVDIIRWSIPSNRGEPFNFIFPCDEEAEDGSNLCIFHDPNVYANNPQLVRDRLMEEINDSIWNNMELNCTGYHLPDDIRISNNFIQPAFFFGVKFHGKVNFKGSQFQRAYFAGTEFIGKVSFSNCTIGKADFSKCKFLSTVSFNHAYFDDKTTFYDADFLGEEGDLLHYPLETDIDYGFFSTDFSFAKFSKEVSFYNVMFSNVTTTFASSTFADKANFSEAKFINKKTAFYESTFTDDADFSKCCFSNEVSFFKSNFLKEANFYRAKFSGKADFSEAKFSGKVTFNVSKFKSCDFRAAEFLDEVSFSALSEHLYDETQKDTSEESDSGLADLRQLGLFDKIEFSDVANFNYAIFSKKAIFKNALFAGRTNFTNATFKDTAYFTFVEFSDEGNFHSTAFQGDIVFQDSEFKKANFSRANFQGETKFSGDSFKDTADFSFASFSGRAIFEDRVNTRLETVKPLFDVQTSFKNTSLGSKTEFRVKDLSNVSFMYTDVTSVRFSHEVRWGKEKKREEEFKVIEERNLEEYLRYSKLIAHSLKLYHRYTRDGGGDGEEKQIPLDNGKHFLNFKVDWDSGRVTATTNSSDIQYKFLIEIEQDRIIEVNPLLGHGLDDIKAIYRDLRENYEYKMRYDEAGQFFIREMELKRKYRNARTKTSDVSKVKENCWFRRNLSLTGLYYRFSNYGESLKMPTIIGTITVALSTLFWLTQADPAKEPSFSKFVGAYYIANMNLNHLEKAFERSIADFLPLLQLPTGINIGVIDYIIKIVGGALTFGLLAIALRRKFERRFRH